MSDAEFAVSLGGIAIYPLWRGSIADCIRQFADVKDVARRNCGIVAVLQDQPSIALEDEEALMLNGLICVQVTDKFRDLSAQQMAEQLESEVDSNIFSSAGLAPIIFGLDRLVTDDPVMPEPTDDELLAAINQPSSDEGGA